MQRRIIISVILSIIIILASLGIISYHYVNSSIEGSLQSRLALANIISKYFDDKFAKQTVTERNTKSIYDKWLSNFTKINKSFESIKKPRQVPRLFLVSTGDGAAPP